MIFDKALSIVGIKNFSEKDYGLLFVYLVTFVPLIYKFISPLFIITGLGSSTIIINPIIMIIGLIIIRRRIYKLIKNRDVIIYLFVCIFLFLSSFVYTNNVYFFEKNYLNFVFCTMSFYFVGLIIDYSEQKHVISAVSKIGLWLQIFLQLCIYLGLIESDSYDDSRGEQMGLAYHLIFCTLVNCIDCFNNFKLSNLIYFIISTLLLFFMGTRGPVIILLAFIVTYLLIIHKFRKNSYIIKSIIVILFYILYSNIEIIILSFIPLANTLGFSTRVFDSILDNRMTDLQESSGRDDIYNTILDALDKDYSGFGWGGDRYILPENVYVHNFELEILIHFGVFIGGFILLFLLITIITSFIKIRFSNSRVFWLVMLFAGLIELQMSQTYVAHPLLFVMIGYFISINRSLSK